MKANRRRLPTDSPGRNHLFQRHLLAWYERNRRDLPWRRDHHPYHVWLAEIMLQQTRVAAVLEHYRKFRQRFPTVKKLAAAQEASVLAAWSGLGYYRRARMLHAAARTIVKEHGGKFPASAEGWRALPGIGRYTAAAIASIAFGEPVAVVDGNVERVLQRLLGRNLRGQEMWQAAEAWLSREHPGDFNQAMMELGATVCLPRAPVCLACPVFDFCATRGELEKPEKGARQSKREIHYSLDCRNGSVFLVKRRKDASLMPGMWELPELSAANGAAQPCLTLRHSITVTDYVVRVSQGTTAHGTDGRWVKRRRVVLLPLTGLARKILRAAQVI
jgi:A/G-specific adenine glycosylase